MGDTNVRHPEHAVHTQRGPRVEELIRRIRAIESDDDARYGSFGAADWIFCVALSVVFPLLLFWWFA